MKNYTHGEFRLRQTHVLKLRKSYSIDTRMGPVNLPRLYVCGTPIQGLYIIPKEVSKMSYFELLFLPGVCTTVNREQKILCD